MAAGFGNRAGAVLGVEARRNGEKQGISIALLIQSLDGRDSEKISIALIIHSLDLLPMRVCGEDRRMAAGFGNPAGAVLGLGSGWKPDVTRGWGIVVVCGSGVSVGKERAREPRPYESQRSVG